MTLEKTSILRHKEVLKYYNDIAWLYVAHYYEGLISIISVIYLYNISLFISSIKCKSSIKDTKWKSVK